MKIIYQLFDSFGFKEIVLQSTIYLVEFVASLLVSKERIEMMSENQGVLGLQGASQTICLKLENYFCGDILPINKQTNGEDHTNKW